MKGNQRNIYNICLGISQENLVFTVYQSGEEEGGILITIFPIVSWWLLDIISFVNFINLLLTGNH